ncbi:MAG: hypothetical protein JSV44_10900 [Candidatus Zixiibacteriota bacterium]|nr:MAG: hypothetical protein JSV44_10900 [candidate division Zixibacteria bacterium]
MKHAVVILMLGLLSIVSANADMPYIVERPDYVLRAKTGQFQEAVDQAIVSARVRLLDILDDSLRLKPDIYIVESLAEFKKLAGTAFPDWGAAAALPYRRLIVIKSPAHFNLGKPLAELVRHEYSHLALAQVLGAAVPPRWLDEGLAMYVSAEWGWQQNLAMSRAVIFRHTVPLHEIERLNRFPEGRAQTAYAQSYLAVKYILDTYQAESFNILLKELRGRRSYDEALNMAVGANYVEFEEEFSEFLNRRYNLVSLFIDTYFLWIFLAVVVFIGFMLQYRKRRKYYQKWEEEEKYRSTDFDYGDPENPEHIEDEDKPWS